MYPNNVLMSEPYGEGSPRGPLTIRLIHCFWGTYLVPQDRVQRVRDAALLGLRPAAPGPADSLHSGKHPGVHETGMPVLGLRAPHWL